MRRILLAAVAAIALAAPAFAACPEPAAVQRLADGLVSGEPVPQYQGLSMADAECARDRLIPLLVPHFGALVGYKAGATGEGVQRRYSLPGPVWGAMFRDTLSIRSGGEVVLTPALRGLGVEADLLVRVRDEGINTAGADHVEILKHLDQVIPYIELPRSSLTGTLVGVDLVSANVNARMGVVGEAIPVQATPEFAARLGTMTVVFADDTRELARAQGSALLGHPLNVIPWLVADLAKSGRRLRAGEIVSLGGFAPSVPAVAGRTYTQTYEGLLAAPVSLSVRFR